MADSGEQRTWRMLYMLVAIGGVRVGRSEKEMARSTHVHKQARME